MLARRDRPAKLLRRRQAREPVQPERAGAGHEAREGARRPVRAEPVAHGAGALLRGEQVTTPVDSAGGPGWRLRGRRRPRRGGDGHEVGHGAAGQRHVRPREPGLRRPARARPRGEPLARALGAAAGVPSRPAERREGPRPRQTAAGRLRGQGAAGAVRRVSAPGGAARRLAGGAAPAGRGLRAGGAGCMHAGCARGSADPRGSPDR
mmetsp:Transcript_70690/g.191109  ORF Transcript_70690/g.191109 Transcript_70690/m.191109 type:complete len:207 (-) Transcript_70690:19-639(-)